MSIATEFERLAAAKSDLKAELEMRGANTDSALISDYADILKNQPYAVSGTFIPEEDTHIFSISGLAFSPDCVYIAQSAGGNDDGITAYSRAKGLYGVFCTRSDNVLSAYVINANTTVDTWQDNGWSITFPSPYMLKKGWVYKYYIAGGFAQ